MDAVLEPTKPKALATRKMLDEAVFVSLGLTNGEEHACRVDVGDGEAADFAEAETGRVENRGSVSFQ